MGVAAWVGVGCAGVPDRPGMGRPPRAGRGGVTDVGCGGGVPAWVRRASARQGRRAVMGQRTLYVLRSVEPLRSSSMSMRLASFSLVYTSSAFSGLFISKPLIRLITSPLTIPIFE